ncbi:uncharacterized protein FIBRA_06237 [Fibroporia radiculosa]|uniref:Cytochrome P450 n=1 Tax=Fibroporia radiculosa TaxID=599839 RepID=J4GAV7_9APHY|nr:uncharacterized protein FIBRA_06237 [Fibroporia radiculosa]CCM04078.1 predicted protein [Fibroporia radiculosa]
MSHSAVLYVTICVLLSCVLVVHHRRRSHSLPPGPRQLPFLGNVFDIPRKDVAATFASWSRQYGDIIYMHVLGREFVILNTAKAALDLFDDRGILYSDRPRSVMSDLVGKTRAVLFHPYGEQLKKHRRLLRNAFNPQRSKDYWQLEEEEARRLVSALAEEPKNFLAHVRQYYGAIALRIAYGYQVKGRSGEDRYVNLTNELARITAKASEPGRWLVDSFPILRYVPAWFPGAGFKRWAQSVRHKTDEFSAEPYNFAKDIATRAGQTSFVSESIELLESEIGGRLSAEDDELLKWTAASIYAGGSDTATALTSSFLLIMAAYPDVQRKAQSELDTVVGRDRFAMMDDQPRLTYIDALIKEVHRLNPVAPLVPHTTLSDDIYRGYRIPKGSWIMANVWCVSHLPDCYLRYERVAHSAARRSRRAMMHDPETFPRPDVFEPERFLKEGGACPLDPRDYIFGFGRRRCPGTHVADSSFFFAVTYILAIFDITNPRDPDGNPMRPAYADGYLSHPKPFTCQITPRSKSAMDLISQLVLSS